MFELKLDLFRIGWLKGLYGNRWFPFFLQIPMLFVFAALIYGGLGVATNDMGFAMTLRNTNLANLIVWSYWWPLVIIVAVVAGRHWCTICPIELVTTLAGKFGLRRSPGRFLRSGWVITLFYAAIVVFGIHTLAIHRIPQRMAIYLLVLVGVSILVGLIWEKRAFCTYVCPVGHLLGLYALLSSTEWRVRSKQVCDDCKTKDCVAKSRDYDITARSCTSYLYPPRIRDNRQCILCAQCLSSCPKDNPTLRLRKPFADLFADVRLTYAEIAFVVMVSGFVVYEILSGFGVTKSMLLAPPTMISKSLGINGIWAGTTKAVVLFLIFPLLFFALLAGLRKVAGGESLKQALTATALGILPIIGIMHLLKSLLKSASRLPYWSYALDDPKGVDTAQALIEGTLHLDKTILQTLDPIMTWTVLSLPIVALGASAYLVMRRREGSLIARMITLGGILLYGALFEVGIILGKLG